MFSLCLYHLHVAFGCSWFSSEFGWVSLEVWALKRLVELDRNLSTSEEPHIVVR